ncbi:transcription initiation factor IIA gamma chain [Heterostelium album PN500]|uniref:Transcription initiation factor IIA subunit 2 n=1 Tax=Heterostelium pallidum (strain ATCC 26659 / Pp 5 / PN500) TaxID=670386 RepID=D3BGP2_HETP5|nr:transcription initiation factor IIA gamma chain [Heterostelium album PN500]EFA79276.1 transcription initiation factor IIA gamma chain [Heterostelium album PN500]|eukprot:XP_020431397.1 transcription initiation factor IIA gamma chain [Heterostelium album PN500]
MMLQQQINKEERMQQQHKMRYYELYRRSTIGEALTDTLDELVTNQYISQQLYDKVLLQFDKSINEALADTVKSKASFKGDLHTYRFCDNVWTFILENAEFKTENETIKVDNVKIVACDANISNEKDKKDEK